MRPLAASNLGPAAVSTTSTYKGPNPSEHGSPLLLYAALAAGAYLLLGGSGATSSATTSAVTSASGSSTGSPALATPGVPIELQQVGGTATSVTVECAMEATATLYSWYSYGSSNLLATSPTNVAVIDGLQTNTGYYVYVVASNASGSSAPSQPLLVTTGAGSPVIIYNQGGSTSSATTSASASGAPALAVSVAASATTVTVGASVTATATLSGGPSNTSPTVIGGQSAGPVAWTFAMDGPTGTTSGSGSGYSVATDAFALDATGTYTITAVAAYSGSTATGSVAVSAQAQQHSGGGGGGGSQPPPPSTAPSVSLSGPSSAAVGTDVTVQATAGGYANPLYQFWYHPPGGLATSFDPTAQNGWVQSGFYSNADTMSFAITEAGTYHVVAFAMEAGTAETHANEVESNVIAITAVATGTQTNASGGSVTLSGPGSGVVGQSVGYTAQATGITDPVYQFWYKPPGSAWVGGGYGGSGFSFTPTGPGGYEVVAYARAASAPIHETAGQRPTYEAESNVITTVVTGSTATPQAASTTAAASPYVGGGQPSGIYSINGKQVSSIPATYTGDVLDISTGTTFYVLRGKFVGNLT